MSHIIYTWEITLKTEEKEKIDAPEPIETEDEIIFALHEGGEKRYKKEEIKSFVPVGFIPFMI